LLFLFFYLLKKRGTMRETAPEKERQQ